MERRENSKLRELDGNWVKSDFQPRNFFEIKNNKINRNCHEFLLKRKIE